VRLHQPLSLVLANPEGCKDAACIITSLAEQHRIAGLPLDTVVAEFEFCRKLTLRKPRADSMLNHLVREWLPDFDASYQLLVVSATAYADGTR
jgi:hypothetical protein